MFYTTLDIIGDYIKNVKIKMKCRICNKKIKDVFCDLGKSPLANSFLKKRTEFKKEKFYPLKVLFCKKCQLPQVPVHVTSKKIFTQYDYFSSYSQSWLDHSKRFARDIIKFLKLNKNSNVCELASNDGYLLQFFKKEKINVLGVEPAKNVAVYAERKKIKTIKDFFSLKLSHRIKKKYGDQHLVISNNVLAHVPDIKNFLRGIKNILSQEGIATFEFPHFLNLIKYNQFDTIYHEHFSYLTVSCLNKLFKKLGLKIFDVKKIDTHGGSLRVYACHENNYKFQISNEVKKIILEEIKLKIFHTRTFLIFGKKLIKIKKEFIKFICNTKKSGKTIAAYGAAAKGNTFLNYCKINEKDIDFIVDKNPSKIQKYLPGSHIKTYNINHLIKAKPNYLIILPWNIKKEIISQFKNKLNCRFVTCIPKIQIY